MHRTENPRIPDRYGRVALLKLWRRRIVGTVRGTFNPQSRVRISTPLLKYAVQSKSGDWTRLKPGAAQSDSEGMHDTLLGLWQSWSMHWTENPAISVRFRGVPLNMGSHDPRRRAGLASRLWRVRFSPGPLKYGSIVYGRLGCNPLKVMNLVRPQMELLKYGTIE